MVIAMQTETIRVSHATHAILDPMVDVEKLWTAAQCAEYLGIPLQTWHSYVNRKPRPKARNPVPKPVHRVGTTPLWEPTEVIQYGDKRRTGVKKTIVDRPAEAWRRLAVPGVTRADVAKAMGVSEVTVYAWVRPEDAPATQVARLLGEGLSVAEVAEKLRITEDQVKGLAPGE